MEYGRNGSNDRRCVQNLALSNADHEFGRIYLYIYGTSKKEEKKREKKEIDRERE